MKNHSPLRYPGGKTALRNVIKKHLDEYGSIVNFVEPYGGGAGVSLWLLLNNYVKRVFINDYDYLIYRIWDAILNDTKNFIEKILYTPVTIEEYYKQKEIVEDVENYFKRSFLEIGFAAFFLNRCNRSGIITKNAGPIGGKNQTGKWKLDARFNKEALVKKVLAIVEHRDYIHISNLDAIEFVVNFPETNCETFFYLDPPYYKIGPELYRKYYNDNDHIKLRNYLVSNRNLKWLVSYDNNDFIKDIYKDEKILEITINHHANIHHACSEILITPKNGK